MSGQLAIAYFASLAVLAIVRPLNAATRGRVIAISAVTSAAIYGLSDLTGAVHDWSPAIILLAAYYMSGLFVVTPSRSIEDWLTSWDRRLLGDPPHAFESWPRWLLASLDIVYLNTFLTVPAGFALLYLSDYRRLADHFWVIVMGSLLLCYAGTAMIHTRPPRVLERTRERVPRRMRHLAFQAVDRFSIGANTIPSGHVAAPLAIGLALMNPLPLAAAVFLVLACVITVACIVGRYHFIVDCVLGAVIALGVWLIA
jgi:hypothetical protein